MIHGPRQCGKTTPARVVGERSGFGHVTFDGETALRAAQADPAGFLAAAARPLILDEIQRVPELFPALKAAVDTSGEPGQFILTGSSNVFLQPSLSESLAGRIALLRLHPLAQCELERGDRFSAGTVFSVPWGGGGGPGDIRWAIGLGLCRSRDFGVRKTRLDTPGVGARVGSELVRRAPGCFACAPDGPGPP